MTPLVHFNHCMEALATARMLADLVEEDDAYTGSHCRVVVHLALEVADALRVGDDVRRDVELGALLHDLGKIAVPKSIVRKPGPLTSGEWHVMRRHTIQGERMLVRDESLAHIGVIVRASHERWDGHGYPDGLAGEAIPLAARIISACDALDAMTSDRPYRRAMSLLAARSELSRCSGTQFDPLVVAALLSVLDGSATAAVA
jgi:HD-GYP domain-containing protein (c-di-GMP phosphodiesterase class II)